MRVAAWIFALAYLAVLGLFVISLWGLFGQSQDPLGGVFLLPLGLPWNLMLDRLTGMSTTALLVAPALTLAILIFLARRSRRANKSSGTLPT